MRNKFKREVSARGLRGIVRANKAGCLDQCEHGVTVVVYPEQVWYGGVTVEDVSEIIDRHIIGGEYVTRLMLPDQPHLDGATSSEALDVPEPKPTGQANETAAQSDKGDDRKPT